MSVLKLALLLLAYIFTLLQITAFIGAALEVSENPGKQYCLARWKYVFPAYNAGIAVGKFMGQK